MHQKQILRMLLSRDFWLANRDRLVPTMFPGDIGTIYETISEAHKKYGHDLTMDEVRALHRIRYATMTRATRNQVEEMMTDIELLEPMSDDVAMDVLVGLWRQETFREIADIAVGGMEGRVDSLEPIAKIIESRADNFLPLDEVEEIPPDLDELLALNDAAHTWKINIGSVAERLPGVSEGEFGIIFARPEVGKTASYISLSLAPGGWCWQGARVHAICNEEPGRKTLLRAVTAATQRDKDWVRENRDEARRIWSRVSSNFRLVDAQGMTLAKLDTYARRHRPDVLIIDQLDKIGINGTYNGSHEKFGALYMGARDIAKKYRCFVLAISQASADAEGKSYLDYSMLAGSKTDKAAEADLIIGIGKRPQPDGSMEEDFTRPWTISKNKISAWHGTVYTVLDPATSTYRD